MKNLNGKEVKKKLNQNVTIQNDIKRNMFSV